MLFGRALLMRLANSPTIERIMKSNGVHAPFVRRFVAGETMEEIVEPVRCLNARGLMVSLDYLGENVKSIAEADEVVAYYLRLYPFIHEKQLDANVSLKLTHLGLDLGDEVAYHNMRRILDCAAEFNIFTRIDMESSAYTARTLEIFYRLWQDYKQVGPVIQAYLYRSTADVERLIQVGARIRLVKGAYLEPVEVAFQQKRDVDNHFRTLMQMLLLRGNYPAIATHDVAMIRATQEFAQAHQITPDRFEFQMLYGIRRDLQNSLVKEGYRMRIYVPFGSQWYPYTMRRLAERPANVWFVLKHLFRR
ncbi:MAG TPA: proline dehydrogenase family protein [Chthonomonadales bacterium]|nr:proline dehydrogenase family protein [Chthonomonadales bacterium]